MQVNSICLFLSILLLLNCSGQTNQSGNFSQGKTEKLSTENEKEFIKVHTLKKNDNSFIGDIYVKFINDSIFTDLYVINGFDTLYLIKKNIFQNKGGKDIEVLEEGFYGYLFVLKRDDYVVLSNFGNNGASISDDITIEWNYSRNDLEVLKVP